jgi:hypothetical protein
VSIDRFAADEPTADRVARCKREHFQSYVGVHRGPRKADEVGAVHVVEGIGGCRLIFYPDEKPWFRVVCLEDS